MRSASPKTTNPIWALSSIFFRRTSAVDHTLAPRGARCDAVPNENGSRSAVVHLKGTLWNVALELGTKQLPGLVYAAPWST